MAHVTHAQRREQLIAATISVMSSVGLDAATSRRIAEAAGAPLASIHYTFGSLEALLAEAYATALEDVLGRFDAAVPRTEGLAAGLAALADVVADAIGDDRYGILLLELSPAGDDRLTEVGARYYAFGPTLVRSILDASGDEVDDPDQLGRFVMAAIDGLVTQYAVHRDPARTSADLRALLGRLAPDRPPGRRQRKGLASRLTSAP